MSELPKGWVESSLIDLAKFIDYRGRTPKKTEEGIPLITAKNIKDGFINREPREFIADADYDGWMTRGIPKVGDVLLTTEAPLGNVAQIDIEEKFALAQRAICFQFYESEVERFVYYYLRSPLFNQELGLNSTGSTVKGIKAATLKKLPVHVAPLAEQKRIVEKLDEVLAQVDTIKVRLDGIPDLLKRFRQSVLASAVSGKLTEEWRGQNDSRGFELSEFAEFWANEYSKAGKKYSAPKVTEDSQVSSILPNSWLNTCVGKIFDVHVGATPSRKDPMYWEGDIPWVSSGEVAFSFITETNEKITESGLSNSSTKIHPCGTVMLAMIGQGKTRGQPAILRIEAAHNQNTAALRVPEGMCVSEFLYYCLWEKYEETRRVGSGNNQKALNKSAVQNLHFPCPPYNEQKEIVRLVDQYFAFADTIEAQVKKAQARVDNLTQSILAKAFRGELVAQDPTDEPADKLLERIAEARKEAEALAKAAKKAEAAKKRAAKSA